eukprot:Skav222469  [mRNA]  locus=scaffold5898:140126:142685:+ [translate_table: standard]
MFRSYRSHVSTWFLFAREDVGTLPSVLRESPHLQLFLKPPFWVVGGDAPSKGRSMARWFQAQGSHPIAWDAEADHGFVHRLDRDTSGLLLCAKTYVGYFAAKFQFNCRRVRKQYIALCQGPFPKAPLMLDFPLHTTEIAPGPAWDIDEECPLPPDLLKALSQSL